MPCSVRLVGFYSKGIPTTANSIPITRLPIFIFVYQNKSNFRICRPANKLGSKLDSICIHSRKIRIDFRHHFYNERFVRREIRVMYEMKNNWNYKFSIP